MIGYVCKYVPVEILEAMGTDPVRLQPSVADFNQADVLMHPNMCSFVKSVLEVMMDGGGEDYEGIVLTTCCDSVRRLYDVLKEKMPDKFIWLLDVPRKVNDFSTGMYRDNVKKMIEAYEAFSGKSFSEADLYEIMRRKAAAASLREAPRDPKALRIGLVGTRCSRGILNLLEDHHTELLFDMTCTGLKREFRLPQAGSAVTGDQKTAVPQVSGAGGSRQVLGQGTGIVTADGYSFPTGAILQEYCWQLLNQVPCLRMEKATGRERFVDGFTDRLDGIICHTVKFCDIYAFEYAQIREDLDIPILQVETDSTRQSEGQIRTRVEAFLESVQMKKDPDREKNIAKKRGGDGKMYVMGVDSGSTSTNAVILDENRKIVAFDVIRTGAKSGDSAERILQEVLERAKLKKEDLSMIVSTGYGRVSIPYADENVTEISCHGRGAHYFNPAVRTVLDIGGQDSKAIHLNEKGEVTDFVMNDKCAAGTGRFLEMMARTLEIDVSELGPISLEWKENIEITSMCSVFAESEVISLIALNKEKPDIAHGIHNAIAGKAYSLMKRVGLEETYMMTGGVAKNPGVVKAVEEKIGASLYICEQPEIVGAVGAAIFALEKCL